MPRLAILCAFGQEIDRLYKHTEISATVALNGRMVWVGRLAGQDVLLATTGIGMDHAASMTRAVIDHFNVSGVVFSGIAGGINPALGIGDVVVPARWGEYPEQAWFAVDAGMLAAARQVAASVELERCTCFKQCLAQPPQVVVGGSGLSSPGFVADAAYRQQLWQTTQAGTLDMESAAVARLASANGIPFIAFRALSDLAGAGGGPLDLLTYGQLAADNAAEVLLKFLEIWGK